MSQALYRKYRSRSLDEVIGQEHITSLLTTAISNGSIHHAYLLTGPRGVGKTSIARIIAHAINELDYDGTTHLDIVEIDAASNNGVDDVRDLRERVNIAPTSARKKVYIIDEVHMLSKPAFNALLKTLEEPPEHAVFILATTDIDKVPDTIISRVQRFNFRAITPDAVAAHLRNIADGENIDIDDQALQLIAKRGGGSFRDSIGLLDQVRSLGNGKTISVEVITDALGIASQQHIDTLLGYVASASLGQIQQTLEELTANGVAPHIIAEQLIERLTANLDQSPEGILLIERLLAVSSSALPKSQLLVALAGQTKPSLANQTNSSKPTAQVAAQPKSKQSSATPAAKPEPQPEPAAKLTTPKQTVAPDGDYSHHKLIAAIDDIALSSLLKNSGSQLVDNNLTVYIGTKFTAKQLDTPAKRQALVAVLDNIGYSDVSLTISADKPPLSDSQSASVAAIMGGGEEVDL